MPPRLSVLTSDDGRRFRDTNAGHLGDDRIVGVVDPKVAHLIASAAPRHVSADRIVDALTLLVEEAEPPLDDRTQGLEVTSFLASGAIAAILRNLRTPLNRWCYALMRHVMAQPNLSCDLRVVHKAGEPPPYRSSNTSCDVVLPHRGLESHLRLSVDSLLRQTHASCVAVAIDQADGGADFLRDIADEPRVQAYRLDPFPVGPYVARHVLASRSRADAIAFQDSDDLSLSHRLATLLSAANESGAGIVGSHEVQVHEPRETVYAIRYPLDVNASLHRWGANHQLLFPMTLVRREDFNRIGGLSTDRTFSLDVAFWLRASFTTRIVNVDEFLYVRRRHPASLTMRTDIGTHSQVRREHVARRRADFAAVLAGTMSLDASSLAVRHRNGRVSFTDVKTGAITMASFRGSGLN